MMQSEKNSTKILRKKEGDKMTWKEVIRKESMARDLSETDSFGDDEHIVTLYDDGESLQVDLNGYEDAEELLRRGYTGRIKQYLERVISEHSGMISRNTLKIAKELGIDISRNY